MGVKDRRLRVSEILHEVLGTNNVYFEPPESKKLVYPCIVYHRKKIDTINADNRKWITCDRYQVTFIRKEADSDVLDKLLELQYCEHNNDYKSEDLYHDVFTLYMI